MKTPDVRQVAADAVSAKQDRPATAMVHDGADARLVAFRIEPGQSVAPHTSASTVVLSIVVGGTKTDRLVPTAVAGGRTFGQITAVYDHTCGLTSAGVGYCWGRNTGRRGRLDSSRRRSRAGYDFVH